MQAVMLKHMHTGSHVRVRNDEPIVAGVAGVIEDFWVYERPTDKAMETRVLVRVDNPETQALLREHGHDDALILAQPEHLELIDGKE